MSLEMHTKHSPRIFADSITRSLAHLLDMTIDQFHGEVMANKPEGANWQIGEVGLKSGRSTLRSDNRPDGTGLAAILEDHDVDGAYGSIDSDCVQVSAIRFHTTNKNRLISLEINENKSWQLVIWHTMPETLMQAAIGRPVIELIKHQLLENATGKVISYQQDDFALTVEFSCESLTQIN